MHRKSTKRADEKKMHFLGKWKETQKKIFDHFKQLIECKLIYQKSSNINFHHD